MTRACLDLQGVHPAMRRRVAPAWHTVAGTGRRLMRIIYPGWNASRAVHIHFKIRPPANQVFTSRLFFDDSLPDQVFGQAPYASKGKRDTLVAKGSADRPSSVLGVSRYPRQRHNYARAPVPGIVAVLRFLHARRRLMA